MSIEDAGQSETLQRILAALRAAGIPHMLTGSLASSSYGEPRTTQDVDLVIDATSAQLNKFLDALPSEDFCYTREAAADALTRRSMFNVIDTNTIWKVDLIFLRNDSFEKEKFARRVQGKVLGQSVEMVTPEDSILSKLHWGHDSASERQYRDALQVAIARWATLDQDYMRHWAKEAGISEDVDRLLRDAERMRPHKTLDLP